MKNLIILLILSLTSGCNDTSSGGKTIDTKLTTRDYEYIVYKDTINGFEINYPSLFERTDKEPRAIFVALENGKDTLDKFNEGMNITKFPNEGLTIDSLASINIQRVYDQWKNPTIQKAKYKNRNGLTCISVKMLLKVKSLDLLSYATLFDNGKYLFTITQTMESGKKEKYEPMVSEVIDSFNWLIK